MTNRPKIVTLCGSSRFYHEYQDSYLYETLAGHIVLSIASHGTREIHRTRDNIGMTPAQKIMLDELHLRKIDLSDEILVIDVGGYISESTRREIQYAKDTGKPVRYRSWASSGKEG